MEPSLQDIILQHRYNRDIGALKKMSQEMALVIEHVSKRANAVLLKGATKEQAAHKYVAMSNLAQAEHNYMLIISSIEELERESHQ